VSRHKRAVVLPNPYHLLLRALSRAGVEYLVIGVSGINYFAKDARTLLSTADYDLFLRPTAENVARAWRAFQKNGYTVVIRQGDHTVALRKLSARTRDRLLKARKTLVAIGPYQLVAEGLLAVSGFTFEQMQRHAVWMKDRELKFRFQVGSLRDLLESKRVADRAKDRLFLARYKRLLLDGE
jgi:hypothetical protein